MPSTINADNGVSSGSAGLKSSADSSGVLSLQTNGTTAVTVDTSQNVGIGTTSPVVKLQSAGDILVPSAGGYLSNIYYSGSWKYAGNGFGWAQSENSGAWTWQYAANNTSGAGAAASPTERMRIDTSGNVGIGTSSPGALLQVSKSDASTTIGGSAAKIVVQNGNGSALNQTSGIEFNVGALPLSQSRLAGVYGLYEAFNATALGGALVFATNSAGSTTISERARINSSGYLLVGTTSAAGNARLVVNNGNNVSGDFGFVTTLGSNCNNTSSYHYIAATGGADKFYVYGNGSAANATGSYGTISDIKLKENIVDATPKLADVMRLQVRNFNLKTEPTHKQIGFVAQEFEQVFPGMVDESPDRDANGNTLETTTKHIKTSVLVPILVKAIQELKAEVDGLKSQLAAKG